MSTAVLFGRVEFNVDQFRPLDPPPTDPISLAAYNAKIRTAAEERMSLILDCVRQAMPPGSFDVWLAANGMTLHAPGWAPPVAPVF